jgi:radical SAM superfamily enzyme YgiQ (UPF0313 family)
MNILLIYPQFPDTFWSFKHALKFIRKKSSSPPLGLLTIAAILPAHWVKRLVDTNITGLTRQDLNWADYAFISAMTVQRDSVNKIITQCKEAGVKVVAGGPLFTVEPDQFSGVDYFVLNEAELTLPAFLADLEQGHPKPSYSTAAFADIQKSPTPIWQLIKLNSYATMSVQFSRGCPFNCDFCNITSLLGHTPRTKTAQQMIAELDGLYNYGWRGGIFFVDDNFIGNKKTLKSDLLPALIEWRKDKKDIWFNTEVSINLADDEQLIKMMTDAGFNMVFIGIETSNEGSLAECGKKQNLNRNLLEDVKKIQRAGMQVQGGFIVGFDHDTASTFTNLIDFIQKSGIVTAMVGILQAPPGTELYKRLQRSGRLVKQISGDNVDGSTNIIPLMDLKILQDKYKSLLKTIYSPKAYYQRVKTFLQEYNVPKIDARLNFQQILAFFRSIFHLGILGKERLNYWKLFFWTLIHKPKAFPLAIEFAIYGYHFRKISNSHVM